MLYIASDHGGFELKQKLIQYLAEQNIEINDLGPKNTESVDYPDYAQKLVAEISTNLENNLGILICGTGIGMSISANKYPNIRAALCHNCYTAKMSRLHNNAQILCLGERVIGEEVAKEIVNTFLNTKFEGGRHQQRLDKINL